MSPTHRYSRFSSARFRGTWRRALAALSSMGLVLGLAVGSGLGSGVANAGTAEGIYNLALTGTGTHDGDPVIQVGQDATLSFEYNTNAQGKTVTVDFPTGAYTFNPAVSATCEASNVPSGNDSIDCIGFSGNTLTVTFKSDFAGSGGGVFATTFKVSGVTGNHEEDVDWAIDGGSQPPINIIVAENPANFAPAANSFSKTRNSSTLNLNDYITITGGHAAVIGGKDLADLKVTYTVELVRNAAGDYAIADTLDDPLVFDSGSLTCQIVTWDVEGLNPNPSAACDGTQWHDITPTATGFSGTATLAGTSKVTLTYTAHPDKTKLLTAIDTWLTSGGGNTIAPALYSWANVQNSATVNGAETKRATTQLQWNKAGVTQGTSSKAVSPTSLTCATISGGLVNASGCLNQTLNYTITYYTNESSAGAKAITDALPAGMAYETGTFAATQAVWDTSVYPPTEGGASGIAFAPTVSGTPETFSGTVNVPAAPAKTAVTYQAKVTDVTALQADLQAKYDALGAASGSVESTVLTNTATAGGTGIGSATSKVTITKGTGISPSTAFNKLVDWTSKTVTGDADAKTTDPVAVVYSLSANLAAIEASAPNTVITDTLPAGMTWDGTVTLGATSTPLTLNKQVTCSTTDPDTFASTTSEGTYCFDGTTLLVNVGKSSATNAVLDVPATITAGLAGLTGTAAGSSYPAGSLKYGFPNSAKFYYGGTGPQSKSATSDLYVRPEATGEDGYHVDAIFNKTTNVSGELHVNAGDSAEIKYTFTVGAGHDIDARTSTITDYIDQSVFDLGVGLSNVTVTGTYDGQALAADDFELAQDGDGNLLITLSSPSGVSVVDTRGVDKAWIVTITLHTKPFGASETHSIYNKAILTGSAGQATYWSDVTADATSFGNEWEAQKLVYDPNATGAPWSTHVTSMVDRDGNLVDNPFVYQIDFIAHGNYGSIAVEPPAIEDLLPTGVTFLGFIDPSVIGTPGFQAAVDSHDTSTQTLGGNLEASYDPAGNGTVTVARQTGLKFIRSGGDGHYRVYFAAKVEGTAGTNIVNTITGGRTATVEPVEASVYWEKTDSSQQNLLGGSEWVITGPSGPDSSTIAVVDNGAQDSDPASGQFLVKPLAPGSYTLTETKAPAGYVLNGTAHPFVVDANHIDVDLGAIVNQQSGGGGGGGGDPTTSSTAPTSPVTTLTTAVTTPTAPTTPTTRVTVTPSSATSPSTPPPPTNVPGTTIPVSPDECTDLVEHGFDPGETVTITVTGEHGQYELTAVADENGDVAFCLRADQPETLIIEVLGANHVVVREVVIGVEDLSYTGVPTVEYLTFALLLLGAGVALTLVGRRGRRGRHFAK